MKNLQDFIIKQYREVYPTDTLKNVSQKTNIQLTRVFRILNGSEMKISEYEAFENVINSDIRQQDFYKRAKECSLILSPARLSSLYAQMSQALKIATLQETNNNNIFTQVELA